VHVAWRDRVVEAVEEDAVGIQCGGGCLFRSPEVTLLMVKLRRSIRLESMMNKDSEETMDRAEQERLERTADWMKSD
jgi:hypothetical protein